MKAKNLEIVPGVTVAVKQKKHCHSVLQRLEGLKKPSEKPHSQLGNFLLDLSSLYMPLVAVTCDCTPVNGPSHILLLFEPTLPSHIHSFLVKPQKSQTGHHTMVLSVAYLKLECYTKITPEFNSDKSTRLTAPFMLKLTSSFTLFVLLEFLH